MKPRHETYCLREGTGRLAVRRHPDGLSTALFVDGKPAVLRWPDHAGSIGEDFFLASPLQADVHDIRRRVSEGFDTNIPLADHILPLLQQFPPGEYTLSLNPFDPRDWSVDWDDWSPQNRFTNRYPHNGTTIILTQPDASLDEARILEWMYAIESGAFPIILTAGTRDPYWRPCEFILDGHHKLVAYAQLHAPIWRLCIRAEQPELLRFEDWPESTEPSLSWKRTFKRFSPWDKTR